MDNHHSDAQRLVEDLAYRLLTAPKRNGQAALLALVFLLPQLALNGFVIATLWAWFIVPLGAPSLSLGVAMGVNLIAQALFPYSVVRHAAEADLKDQPDRLRAVRASIVFNVVADLWFLALGFIIHALVH